VSSLWPAGAQGTRDRRQPWVQRADSTGVCHTGRDRRPPCMPGGTWAWIGGGRRGRPARPQGCLAFSLRGLARRIRGRCGNGLAGGARKCGDAGKAAPGIRAVQHLYMVQRVATDDAITAAATFPTLINGTPCPPSSIRAIRVWCSGSGKPDDVRQVGRGRWFVPGCMVPVSRPPAAARTAGSPKQDRRPDAVGGPFSGRRGNRRRLGKSVQ